MNYGQLNAGNLNEWWPQMGSEVTISAQLLVREKITGEVFRRGVLGLPMTAVLLYMRAAAEQAEWDLEFGCSAIPGLGVIPSPLPQALWLVGREIRGLMRTQPY